MSYLITVLIIIAAILIVLGGLHALGYINLGTWTSGIGGVLRRITIPTFGGRGGGWFTNFMLLVTVIVGIIIFDKFLPEASHRMWSGGWLRNLMFISLGIAVFWDYRHKSFRPLIFFALALIMFIKLVSVKGGAVIEDLQAALRGQEVKEQSLYSYNLAVPPGKTVTLGRKKNGDLYFPAHKTFDTNQQGSYNLMYISHDLKDTAYGGPDYVGRADFKIHFLDDSILVRNLEKKQIVLSVDVYER